MSGIERKGAEEARNHLPELLAAAEQGRSTVITRHGRAIAMLTPIGAARSANGQQPLTPVAGSGRGLWGEDSADAIGALREEWGR